MAKAIENGDAPKVEEPAGTANLESNNYYEILGIAEDATPEQIRKAYRRLALKLHPDKNPNDQERAHQQFQKVNRAHQILADPTLRKVYDRGGEEGLKMHEQMGGQELPDFFYSCWFKACFILTGCCFCCCCCFCCFGCCGLCCSPKPPAEDVNAEDVVSDQPEATAMPGDSAAGPSDDNGKKEEKPVFAMPPPAEKKEEKPVFAMPPPPQKDEKPVFAMPPP